GCRGRIDREVGEGRAGDRHHAGEGRDHPDHQLAHRAAESRFVHIPTLEAAPATRGPGAVPMSPGPVHPVERREWDLNPRCHKDTTVFETVRFGRSRIPPAAIT